MRRSSSHICKFLETHAKGGHFQRPQKEYLNEYPAKKHQAFPFDPNPDWSRFYASGGDILAYMKATVKKWSLDRDLQLSTRVIGAHWQPQLKQWKVTVEHEGRQRDEFCHVLISAQGVLV
jgi:cation diffusion facilitator CzcD-associated flavoprotein CzcO